ncbi:MAG: hypothetical protein PHX74_00860 [Candidatus Sumerlaeales bacterium]|nr:hypothetical protein [Candidatus Sumerlaeales bacterium]
MKRTLQVTVILLIVSTAFAQTTVTKDIVLPSTIEGDFYISGYYEYLGRDIEVNGIDEGQFEAYRKNGQFVMLRTVRSKRPFGMKPKNPNKPYEKNGGETIMADNYYFGNIYHPDSHKSTIVIYPFSQMENYTASVSGMEYVLDDYNSCVKEIENSFARYSKDLQKDPDGVLFANSKILLGVTELTTHPLRIEYKIDDQQRLTSYENIVDSKVFSSTHLTYGAHGNIPVSTEATFSLGTYAQRKWRIDEFITTGSIPQEKLKSICIFPGAYVRDNRFKPVLQYQLKSYSLPSDAELFKMAAKNKERAEANARLQQAATDPKNIPPTAPVVGESWTKRLRQIPNWAYLSIIGAIALIWGAARLRRKK